MKLRARNVAWLLPFLLTACFHKTHQQQVQSLAPPATAQPEPTPPGSPSSAGTVPGQPANTGEGTSKTGAGEKPSSKPQPPVRHRKPSAKPAQPAASGTPAANPETPAVSVIGQLSSGDPSGLRRETVSSMEATERGLNGIGRTLNGQEQITAAQIRSFLKQAREALAAGDVDGAHTLAAKAKVLLGELVR
jgi:hypothetical protein